MTRFKTVLSAVVLGTALVLPAFGQAGPGGGGGGGAAGPGGGGGRRFGGGGQPASPIQRIEATQKAVMDLATDQQKPKLDEMFKKLGTELAPLKERLAKLEAEKKEIDDKIAQLAAAARNDLNDLLTEEQKVQLRDKLAAANPGGGGGAGAGGFGGGGMAQMIQSRAEELKLTPEQKDKLTKLGTDMQDKMAKIRESAGNDRQAMGTAMRTAFQDLQAKLKEILTPEQMDKVQQMMPARGQGGGGQGGGGQGGGGRRGGGGGQGGGAGNIQ